MNSWDFCLYTGSWQRPRLICGRIWALDWPSRSRWWVLPGECSFLILHLWMIPPSFIVLVVGSTMMLICWTRRYITGHFAVYWHWFKMNIHVPVWSLSEHHLSNPFCGFFKGVFTSLDPASSVVVSKHLGSKPRIWSGERSFFLIVYWGHKCCESEIPVAHPIYNLGSR